MTSKHEDWSLDPRLVEPRIFYQIAVYTGADSATWVLQLLIRGAWKRAAVTDLVECSERLAPTRCTFAEEYGAGNLTVLLAEQHNSNRYFTPHSFGVEFGARSRRDRSEERAKVDELVAKIGCASARLWSIQHFGEAPSIDHIDSFVEPLPLELASYQTAIANLPFSISQSDHVDLSRAISWNGWGSFQFNRADYLDQVLRFSGLPKINHWSGSIAQAAGFVADESLLLAEEEAQEPLLMPAAHELSKLDDQLAERDPEGNSMVRQVLSFVLGTSFLSGPKAVLLCVAKPGLARKIITNLHSRCLDRLGHQYSEYEASCCSRSFFIDDEVVRPSIAYKLRGKVHNLMLLKGLESMPPTGQAIMESFLRRRSEWSDVYGNRASLSRFVLVGTLRLEGLESRATSVDKDGYFRSRSLKEKTRHQEAVGEILARGAAMFQNAPDDDLYPADTSRLPPTRGMLSHFTPVVVDDFSPVDLQFLECT